MAARYNTLGDYSNLHHTQMVTSDRKFTFPSEIYLPAVKNYVMAKSDDAYNYLLYTAGVSKYNPVQYRWDKFQDIKKDALPLADRVRNVDDYALTLPRAMAMGQDPRSDIQVGFEAFQADPRPAGCACSSTNPGVPLDKVFNPEFNMREVGKQMILLEDHLFNPYRRCNDCITKHTLMIEALIEEAITLDENRKYDKELQKLLAEFRGISRSLLKDVKSMKIPSDKAGMYAQNIRLLRKPICRQYCDFH
jgi:hypothetical protein